MIKIAFFTHYSKLYGANKSLLNLIDGLKQYKVEVVVFVPKKGPLLEELDKKGVKYHHIRFYDNAFSVEKRLGKCLGALKFVLNRIQQKKIIKLLSNEKVDLIHSNSSVLDIGIKISQQMQKPHIWHIREFGVEDYGVEFFPNNNAFLHLLNETTHAFFVSQNLRNNRIKDKNQLQNTSVLYNGVVSEKDIVPRQYLIGSKITFAIIGVIQNKKNQLQAVQAIHQTIKNNPKCTINLLIVGQGDNSYIEILKTFIAQNNLQNHITFTGHIRDIKSIYNAIDVLLMCSPNEAMGRVTVEAMANGVPVIGKQSGGTPELIENNYNGYLYNSNNELLEKIQFLINDTSLIQMLGKNAQSTALNKFTVEKYAQKYYHIIEQKLTHHYLKKLDNNCP